MDYWAQPLDCVGGTSQGRHIHAFSVDLDEAANGKTEAVDIDDINLVWLTVRELHVSAPTVQKADFTEIARLAVVDRRNMSFANGFAYCLLMADHIRQIVQRDCCRELIEHNSLRFERVDASSRADKAGNWQGVRADICTNFYNGVALSKQSAK